MRALAIFLMLAGSCRGYSVLTHEAIIDSVWDSHFQPALLKRFPRATPDDLKQARAYAYGGALIDDIGYIPLSSRPFSDLTHYVRTGDFVTALARQAANLNEYAFALGNLSHYVSDSTGHTFINRIEPLVYPKLRRKFGPVVTYEDDPARHLKTEFALDVIQVSRGSYAPDSYHDFIGFEVSQALLERGFESTYGFPMHDIFLSEDLAIGTFRFTVGKMVPEMTKVAWSSKRKDIENLAPGIQRKQFVYRLPRREYEKEWDGKYKQPGWFARFLAFLFRLIPTVGPFKALGFRPVPAEGEKLFLNSLEATAARYGTLLDQEKAGTLKLAALNLDTGEPSRADAYRLAGETYVKLLDQLSKGHFQEVSPALRSDILAHFDSSGRQTLSAKTLTQLEELRGVTGRAALE